MDIKEIAERVSKRIYVEDGLLLSKFISEKFAEALIESYKAELLKEAGEPVSYLHKEFSWKNRQSECVVKITLKAQPEYGFTTPLYTSDQVAAAILKATKPLEKEVERLKGMVSEIQAARHVHKEHNRLLTKLAAAQEENGRLENQVLARDAELWGRTQEILGLKDQLAKAEQLWQVAQGRCDGLEEKLAKAEQRVAEACALTYLEDYDLTDIAERVRAGEWRKFVKEV